MSGVLLRTFQQLSRVAQLDADGVLVSDWERVTPQHRPAYRAMVAAMARAGVDTQGRPPMWAWRGRLRLLDAALLLDPTYELSTGYATVEFEAPPELIVASDYGAWNDHLEAWVTGKPREWDIAPEPAPPAARPPAARAGERRPEQVCLPYLRAEWVREIRPLPTSGWDELDQTLSA